MREGNVPDNIGRLANFILLIFIWYALVGGANVMLDKIRFKLPVILTYFPVLYFLAHAKTRQITDFTDKPETSPYFPSFTTYIH